MNTSIPFSPRVGQDAILKYSFGLMGISAVPGSGKTWTLSRLAAQIIREDQLADDQEILIVTLINSAVENFYQRISGFLQQENLLPNIGYRVRTLHGLSHDIVRERPELAGLDTNFQILDERESDSIIAELVHAWLRSHPNDLSAYLKPDIDDHWLNRIQRDALPELLQSLAQNSIRFAKDNSWTSSALLERLDQLPIPLPLAEMGANFYTDYQRALAYRGAVDFDDLNRLALMILKQDNELVTRLQKQWPYILEDEAQDSSQLQQDILSVLTEGHGNWVRVGDPNQAIYETFTTANPKLLREFIRRSDVRSEALPVSGRSSKSIITLANELVRWTMNEHPYPEAGEALQAPPYIEPAPPDDPSPNPPDEPSNIHLVMNKYSPDREILAVAESLSRWLPKNQDKTVAVLAPRNHRAFELVDELKRRGIEYTDSLLKSSSATRFSANILGNILRYLSDPQSASKLAAVFLDWQREAAEMIDTKDQVAQAAEILRKCRRVEEFTWPILGKDWLESLDLESNQPEIYALFIAFRSLIQRWQSSVLLPIDQIILTISQDLLHRPTELALAHKFAMLLRQTNLAHPSWRLPEMAEELMVIARNERRFIGFSSEDDGFNPDMYKGKVVVSTIHKAKGLEWDRVYIMSVNNYDFPSGQAQDQFISEKWFIRDNLNLEAEALEQLKYLMANDSYEWYEEGKASNQARLDYIRERLRLLYVAITRARSELVLTWNTGKIKGEQQPAVPLISLYHFWQQVTGKESRLVDMEESA